MAHHTIEAVGIRATLDLSFGQLAAFEVVRDGRTVAPLARVPWADGPDDTDRFPPDMPPHLRAMSGDFFCAPFGADDVEDAPPHGWTANAPWELVEDLASADGRLARFRLTRAVAGAQVEKLWRLVDNHPFLYQRHIFHGGSGALPVAHHAMVDLRSGGLLAFSPKARAETPDVPLETDPAQGHSHLAYPAASDDLTRFPTYEGGQADLTRFPLAEGHTDFVMLPERASRGYGWATALRPVEGDVTLLIRDVAQLPATLLWWSHGGRFYPPWNGEHRGVLGIEDGRSWGGAGRSRSAASNPWSDAGVPTALTLEPSGSVAVSHALGALPTGARAPVTLDIEFGQVRLSDGTASPLDTGFLSLS